MYVRETGVFSATPPWRANAFRVQGGSGGSLGATSDARAVPGIFEYAALHRVGSAIYCWAAGADSNWQLVGSGTHTDVANFDRIGILVRNGNPSSPSSWPAVYGMDFIRVINDANFPL
jgi:hypothetical protein